MLDGKAYTYVLLRYRHDPLAGETANVGVVVHCADAAFLGVKVRRTIGRLSKMFRDVDKASLLGGLKAIERGVFCVRDRNVASLLVSDANAATLARSVLPDDDSSLIWSTMGSGITKSAADTLDKLYDRFVGLHDEVARVGRDDDAVWQPVRDRLADRNLTDRFQSKVIISPIDQVEFEHAWKNGAWHCYQPLSFDLTSGDSIREKAARWSGHMTGISRAPESVRPHFIVGQPSNDDLTDDYRRAIDLLRASALTPEVFEETQVDALIERIQREIDLHDEQTGTGAAQKSHVTPS